MDSRDISVVIASHNAGRLIEEALTSVACQTAPVKEVIVVDDASSDLTVQRIQKLELPITISIQELPQNKGRAICRNIGCNLASGSWIACLDHDDIWLPNKIETQVHFINHYGGRLPLVAVGSRGRHINLVGRDLGLLDFGVNSEEEFLRLRDAGQPVVMPHSSALFRKDIFVEVGGYDGAYNGADDAELWSRMAEKGAIINCSSEVILFRKHTGSGSIAEFLEVLNNKRWLEANLRLKTLGQPTLSKDKFLATEAELSMSNRWAIRRETIELYRYRLGSSSLANGRYVVGALNLALAFTLNPRKVISGFRRYFL